MYVIVHYQQCLEKGVHLPQENVHIHHIHHLLNNKSHKCNSDGTLQLEGTK